jgi:hypothetical protein
VGKPKKVRFKVKDRVHSQLLGEGVIIRIFERADYPYRVRHDKGRVCDYEAVELVLMPHAETLYASLPDDMRDAIDVYVEAACYRALLTWTASSKMQEERQDKAVSQAKLELAKILQQYV